MRSKLIIVVSILAVVVLILIQIYIIREYYRLKSRDFDIQYAQVVYNALTEYDQYSRVYLFDSLNYVFNHIALDYLNQPVIHNDLLNPDTKQKILSEFLDVLNHEEKNKLKIIQNLKLSQLDTSFISKYIINEIAFLDFDSIIPVYQREIENSALLNKEQKGFFVKSYVTEGDFYRINFDFYADFTKKGAIILAEMRGLLMIIIVTIVVVLLAFIYTIYSYARQKKLADLKGDFIDHITHEFKTPLSTISVAVSSLKRSEIKFNSGKIDEITSIINKQNRFLTQMIEHVIETSQLERNQLILSKKNIEVKLYVQQLIQDFLLENQDKKINIQEEYLVDDKFSYALDPLQFSRLIYNILSNSVKYSPKDVLIHLRISVNEYLKMEFTDNGIGIAKNELEHIFIKFYRVKGEFTGGIKGLGLGLYLVKMIVEAHEGLVDAESEPGKRTTIIIRLPLNQKER